MKPLRWPGGKHRGHVKGGECWWMLLLLWLVGRGGFFVWFLWLFFSGRNFQNFNASDFTKHFLNDGHLVWWFNELYNELQGGGFKYFLDVHPYLGKIPILTNMFQMGWFNHRPDSDGLRWAMCLSKLRDDEWMVRVFPISDWWYIK